jgi:hypothetical protein
MSNRNRHRERRRRRPPPRGFAGRGWGEVYRMALPVRGPQKRAFFHGVSRYGALTASVFGTMLGYCVGGVIGAAIGSGRSVASAARYLVKNRFYRG